MSTPLNDKFVASIELESYFVDKDNGFPLAGGEVTFYIDTNRTVKKPVYQLTGAPGSYALEPLENPLTLSSVGTFQDELGNNIQIYYYPFEGDPSDESSVYEKYYITVKSSEGVPQFTRENWPPIEDTGGNNNNADIKNYIPNGQFLIYNDIISSDISDAQPPYISQYGILSQPIAQGGWFFQRSIGGTSSFNNSFTYLGGVEVAGLKDFPNAFFNFICDSYNSSDTIRDLVISFPGVHTLSAANPPGSEPFDFFFASQSLDANTYSFEVRVIQNFGTGGSPTATIDTLIDTVNVGSLDYHNVIIPSFDSNTATLGTDKNDYVAISIRGPASSFAAAFTDFALVVGDLILNFFPIETKSEVLSETIYGRVFTPRTDGWNLYLTPQYTLEGTQFDMSEIGDIIPMTNVANFTNSLSTNTNRMMCDGNSYITADYSPLGIPFARLQSVLWNSTYKVPVTGTGLNFATVYVTANPSNQIRISTNKPGLQTLTADGSNPTGFLFYDLCLGVTTYAVIANLAGLSSSSFQVAGTLAGSVLAIASAGTSGFTVNQIYSSPKTKSLFSVDIGANPLAGSYFTFSNTTTQFYAWFTINGVGADPAPGGTGILIPILSTYTTSETAQIIVNVISGYQVSMISTTSATTLIPGSFFQFYANSLLYNVWYEVQGIGNEPTVGGTNIKVSVLTADTGLQVSTKTQIAINMYSFASPNLQGVILKGYSSNANTLDPSPLSRYSVVDVTALTTGLNSYQDSANIEHNHGILAGDPNGSAGGSDDLWMYDINGDDRTSFEGFEESRPLNYAVNYVIKY
jgi:hypothetical protein